VGYLGVLAGNLDLVVLNSAVRAWLIVVIMGMMGVVVGWSGR